MGTSSARSTDGVSRNAPSRMTTTTTSEMLTQVSEAVANAANVLEDEEQDPAVLISKLSTDGAKGLGSVFSYATSKWALCCIAMVCYPSGLTLNKETLMLNIALGYHP